MLNDAVTTNDSVTREIHLARSTSDSPTLSDQAIVSKHLNRSASDGLTLSDVADAALFSLTGSDTIGFSDSAVIDITRGSSGVSKRRYDGRYVVIDNRTKEEPERKPRPLVPVLASVNDRVGMSDTAVATVVQSEDWLLELDEESLILS